MSKITASVVTEVRVYKVGEHFYADASFGKIIERYSKAFGKVVLITRVIAESEKRKGYVLIDDYCEKIRNVGSLGKFLLKPTSRGIVDEIKKSDLVILRLPSIISVKIVRFVRKYSKKYMVEVMGCAWDAYWNRSFTGKMVAPFLFLKTKKIVWNADYCVYVTQKFLQGRYPNKDIKHTIGLSNVDIRAVDLPKNYDKFDKHNFSIMTAAALNVKYKGQEYVIKAIRDLKNEHGMNIQYYLAGKGDDSKLRRIAEKNGVQENVVFLGMLSREKLSEYMRKADFYIQPSLQEGLPRSLIEAMSKGTVCFGSKTAGIPELLESNLVFKRKSSGSIVEVLLKTISTKNFSAISKRNIEESKKYLSETLEKRRKDFYNQVLLFCGVKNA